MPEKCPQCGAPMEDGVCSYCGYEERTEPRPVEDGQPDQPPLPDYPPRNMPRGFIAPPSRKRKGIALFLCLFLGWTGAHRFYVGKVGTGLIYLITGGLFGLGWVVDILLIASGAFKDEFGLRLQK